MRESRTLTGFLRTVALTAGAAVLAAGLGVALTAGAAVLAAGLGIAAEEAGQAAGPSGAVSLAALKQKYRRPASSPFPDDNPFSRAKAELGRMLFFDPRLSKSKVLSCGTCHNPSLSWEDGLARAVGHGMKQLERRTPTLVNVAWGAAFMWDGRAATLEEQVLIPIRSRDEMNMPLDEVAGTVRAIPGYRERFSHLFPADGVTVETIAKAIATFERTIVSETAPFDRWIEGDETAISEAAKQGFVLFNTGARCSRCHSGWRFTDDSFHDIGLDDDDVGRGKLVPEITKMQHAFKTPGLRNVARRGPYMHDGSIPDLAGVIEHYDEGGIDRPSRSAEMSALDLTVDGERDLAAFLETLTSEDLPVTFPRLPR
jgi:cytochrome c peroxidase